VVVLAFGAQATVGCHRFDAHTCCLRSDGRRQQAIDAEGRADRRPNRVKIDRRSYSCEGLAMTHQMLIVFAVLAVAVGLFVWGRPRADIVGLLVVVALMSSRVLTPNEALAGFGSPVVILIAAIFIVSEGLVNTGVAQRLGDAVVRAGRGNETRLVALIMLLAGIVGSVLNSSAIAAMLIPVVLTITNKTGLNRKRLLMPLGVAVMISGMMTLIATSPNIIIENILRERGISPPLGFFSFTPFGLVTLAIGIVFMLLAGRDLLSRTRIEKTGGIESPKTFDVISSYGLDKRWHRLLLRADSPLIGQSVAAARGPLHDRYELDLLGFEKHEKHPHAKARYLPALPEAIFEADDVLFTLVDEDRVPALTTNLHCSASGPLPESQRQQVLQDLGVAEVMPAPESKLIGSTVGDLDLSSHYRVTVLAIRHRGQPITEDLAPQTLDFGDTLLIGGNWDDINRLSDDRQNFVLLTLPEEYEERLPARRRAPIAVAILVAMVAVMALQVLPNADAALVAALAMIAAGCVRVDSIYRVISWRTLVLIAGMLPLATALSKTGATTLMANDLVRTLGSLGPILMLAVVFLITALVGLFISNSATAVLIAPVAIEAARALHVSPQGFAMTVAIACSAAFVTPVSSPSNMLIMEPGGYRFGDYVKVGLPMLFLAMLVTVALAKVIYLPG
jgi:di/tricarboxylate transporter